MNDQEFQEMMIEIEAKKRAREQQIEAHICMVLETDNTPRSLTQFFRLVEMFGSPGDIVSVIIKMHREGTLERVKGTLKSFGCMVKHEKLYRLREN